VKERKDKMEELTVSELQATMERLLDAATTLEKTIMRIAEQQTALAAEAESQVGRIVATVETQRETELEKELEEAKARIAELSAASANPHTGRKTLPASTASMLAKQGVATESIEAGALDGALASLSVEQRIAVKSELLRSGFLG
jgi:predicted RNase H-like nuclease (RuvC/YqgF family)